MTEVEYVWADFDDPREPDSWNCWGGPNHPDWGFDDYANAIGEFSFSPADGWETGKTYSLLMRKGGQEEQVLYSVAFGAIVEVFVRREICK